MGGGMGGGQFPTNAPGLNQGEVESQFSGPWQRSQAILSPGDRVEYTLDLAAGDVLMAGARSSAFDPALVLERDKRKLAENDDRRTGDQAPFLLFRAKDAGSYRLIVRSYGEKSGGQFNLSYAIFRGVTVPLVYDQPVEVPGNPSEAVAVVELEKGKTYTFGIAFSTGTNDAGTSSRTIVGPSGVASEDFDRIPSPNAAAVIRPKKSGLFVLSLEGFPSVPMYSRAYPVSVVSVALPSRSNVKLEPHRVTVIETEVRASTAFRIRYHEKALASESFNFVSLSQEPYMGTQTPEGKPAFVHLRENVYRRGRSVGLPQVDGTYRLAVYSGESTEVAFEVDTNLPEWSPDTAATATLDIGDRPVFRYNALKSEIARVGVRADAFTPNLAIYDVKGVARNQLIAPPAREVGDELYFPNQETFFLQVSVAGDGGAGTARLERAITVPSLLTLGAWTDATLRQESVTLYEVDLEAGKAYEFSIERGGASPSLLSPSGEFLNAQFLALAGRLYWYFNPKDSGRYRVWLRNGNGPIKFRLRPFVPDPAE